MFRNYLKIAVRQLIKNKSYLIINTLGMGVALACGLTAYILVAFNIEFDSVHDSEKTRNIAKVMAHFEYQDGQQYQNMVAPTVMAPIAAEEISGINRYTRFIRNTGNLTFENQSFTEDINFADDSFFDLFEFPLISGTVANFKEKESIYLDPDLATKFFGETDPIGKQMTVSFRDNQYDVIVRGVFEKIPLNSSFTINALIRIETFIDLHEIGENDWSSYRDASTLFELADINRIEEISAQLNKYTGVRNEMKSDATVVSYELIPFSTTVSDSDANWTYLMTKISFVPLLVFITMASIILLIACFNLTNTTIALTGKRMKEIGVRKVVGASRMQIVGQFILEMSITIILAMVVGLGISQIMIPEFTAMWDLAYGFDELSYINLFATLIFLLFTTALLAGAYPAINNSRFKPVSLLKGQTKVKGTNVLTRILLVTQFSLSVIVLVAGILFTLNSKFQKEISLGYDMPNILVVSIQGTEEYNGLKNAILNHPQIEGVAITDHHIGYGSYKSPIKIDTTTVTANIFEVGANYFDVIGMGISKGRGFIEGSTLDLEKSAIIDEHFVEFHKLNDPLGTKILFQDAWYEVVGVVGNHFDDLWGNERIENGNFFRMAKNDQVRRMVVRVKDSDQILETQEMIEQEWKKLFPGKPFNSRMQDDIVFANVNQTNRNLTVIFLFLTFLGCLLSASGIYALANLNIGKRTKEIGIRKVLGASVGHILRIINKEFFIILVLAMFFGGVGGYVLIDALLDDIYPTHIEVGVLPVFLCGLLIFIIGMSTTSSTIIMAARNNPVKTLRDE